MSRDNCYEIRRATYPESRHRDSADFRNHIHEEEAKDAEREEITEREEREDMDAPFAGYRNENPEPPYGDAA
jgi:hypothetical protein